MAKPSRVIVIDVENKNGNNPIFFFPLGRNLIPTYSKAKEKGTPNAILSTAGEIYGERLIVDLDAQKVTIVQRMRLAEHKALLNVIRRVANSESGGFRGSVAGKPADDETFNIASPLEMRTWLYWLRRLVDSKGSIILEGEEHLPSVEQLVQQGDIRIGDVGNLQHGQTGKPFNLLNADQPASAKPVPAGAAN